MINISINDAIIKNIKLVIFDKDGTLMELFNYWSKMVELRVNLAMSKLRFDERYKRRIMYEMGVDVEMGRLRSEGPVGLKKREAVMQAMIDALAEIGFKGTHDLCFQIFKDVDSLSVQHLSEIIKPINGMGHLIESLKRNDCKIAIATTDKTKRARLAMKFLGITDKIDIVVGEDMVKNYKPHPDMIELILDRLNIYKKDAVMVGDAITDVEMGINAGLSASIGVCSGLTSREKLAEKTPYVVEDISQIDILQSK